jgi:membrane-associated PAP2 superfamily phosphatase
MTSRCMMRDQGAGRDPAAGKLLFPVSECLHEGICVFPGGASAGAAIARIIYAVIKERPERELDLISCGLALSRILLLLTIS